MEEISHAKIEIIPNRNNKYPYLYPDDEWTFQIDERVTPSWLLQMHKDKAWEAWAEWKKIVYQFNYKEALNPINPLKIRKHKPSKQDILTLQKWASVWASVGASVWASVRDSVRDSVRASVRASVWDSVGASVWASVRDSVWDSVRASVGASVGDSVRDSVWDSVGDSVGDSVWAYVGTFFPGIKAWKYTKETEDYPFQSAVDLWKRGLIPSFDGKVWRLHSGKDMQIVFEITKEELAKVK